MSSSSLGLAAAPREGSVDGTRWSAGRIRDEGRSDSGNSARLRWSGSNASCALQHTPHSPLVRDAGHEAYTSNPVANSNPRAINSPASTAPSAM